MAGMARCVHPMWSCAPRPESPLHPGTALQTSPTLSYDRNIHVDPQRPVRPWFVHARASVRRAIPPRARHSWRYLHRRGRRPHFRILRLFRVRPGLRAGLPEGLLPLRQRSGRAVLLVRDFLPGLHRAADRLAVLPVPAARAWARHQTDRRTFPDGHGHGGHRLPAELCLARRHGHRRPDRASPGPGIRDRRQLGRPGLAAGAQCARRPPRPLRHHPAAGRADRLHPRRRAVRVPADQPVPGRILRLGLALSLLRGLRHQRGGPVRAPAPGGDARILRPDEAACAGALAGRRTGALRRAAPSHWVRSRRWPAMRCSTW